MQSADTFEFDNETLQSVIKIIFEIPIFTIYCLNVQLEWAHGIEPGFFEVNKDGSDIEFGSDKENEGSLNYRFNMSDLTTGSRIRQ